MNIYYGSRLKRTRELLRLNMRELAQRAGVTHTTIAKLEGIESTPSVNYYKAESVARAVHTEVRQQYQMLETLAAELNIDLRTDQPVAQLA